MAISGGFGVSLDLVTGRPRRWYMRGDGIKRWISNDMPFDAAKEADANSVIADQNNTLKAMAEALELALEYWRDRQQRYKNRKPRWVADAEAALAAHRKGGES